MIIHKICGTELYIRKFGRKHYHYCKKCHKAVKLVKDMKGIVRWDDNKQCWKNKT